MVSRSMSKVAKNAEYITCFVSREYRLKADVGQNLSEESFWPITLDSDKLMNQLTVSITSSCSGKRENGSAPFESSWLVKKKGARFFSLSDNMAAQKQRNCKIIFDSEVLLVFFKGWLVRLVRTISYHSYASFTDNLGMKLVSLPTNRSRSENLFHNS